MKPQAIICDMDGTLVQYPIEPYHSTWDALSLAFSESKRKEWIEIRDSHIKKRGGYDAWFAAQLNLLKGTLISEVNKHIFPIPYSKGVVSFFNGLNGNCLTGILSAGVNIVAEKIMKELGLDFQFSNYLEVDKGKFTGKGKIGVEQKEKILQGIVEGYGLKLENIIFVGDGYGDIPIFKIVGTPVAYGRKFDEVTKRAKYVIDDFRELNNILQN
jgi:HAD superfamily phosphoserine phosphatase-like hydrolase